MSDNTNETIIAKGTRFEGAMKSDCNVTLGGKFDGEIAAPMLKVESGGTVDGRVEVTTLGSQGEVFCALDTVSNEYRAIKVLRKRGIITQ